MRNRPSPFRRFAPPSLSPMGEREGARDAQRRGKGEGLSLLINLATWLLGLFAIAPLLWMLSVSLMQPGEAAHFPPPLLPRHPTFRNYVTLFATTDMARFFLNSLILATLATLISTMVRITAG